MDSSRMPNNGGVSGRKIVTVIVPIVKELKATITQKTIQNVQILHERNGGAMSKDELRKFLPAFRLTYFVGLFLFYNFSTPLILKRIQITSLLSVGPASRLLADD